MAIGTVSIGTQAYAAANPVPVVQNYTSGVWGSTIPISAGYRMITGVNLWAGPPIQQNVQTVTDPIPPGFPADFPPVVRTSWEIARSFAVGLGFKLSPGAKPSIRRIWADGTLIWSNNGDSQPFAFGGAAGYTPNGVWVNGIWTPAPSHQGPSSSDPNFVPPAGPAVGIVSNLKFRFYEGTEDQAPDSAIGAALGDLAPAFRGLMYLVFDGLVMGSGIHYTNNGGGGSGNTNNVDIHSVAGVPGYPVINVELTDAAESVVRVADATMLPDAVELREGSSILADFVNREIVMITRLDDGGGWLESFDIDSGAQTSHIPITGMSDPTEGIGPDAGFAVWDKLNQVIYTYSTNHHGGDEHILIAVGRDGAIISEGVGNTAFGPSNVDGSNDPTHWTTAKPAIFFPKTIQGDLTYLVQAGQLQPVFFTGNDQWCVAVTPNAGVVPTGFEGISVYKTPLQLSNVFAYPTYQDALTNRTQYQDAAFLFSQFQGGIVTTLAEVRMVFVSNVRRGPNSVAKVLGDQLIHTAANLSCVLRVMVDTAGNILVQEHDADAGDIVVYRYNCVMSDTPDFTVAPGWQGRFPQVGALSVDAKVTGENGNPWNAFALASSDMTAGTFSGGGPVILNINDLSVTQPGDGGEFNVPVGNPATAWDSVTGTRWFSGNQSGPFGVGLCWVQAINGLDGSIGNVGEWVREMSLYVGTDSGDIVVDSSLNAQVPGVVITKPYDLTKLFNDIGALYDFSYFNSGGKMRFTSSSNNPIKATGTWTITASGTSGTPPVSFNIDDGATATIGTFVYRFKLVPVAPFDVKICTDTPDPVTPGAFLLDAREKTVKNFAAAIAANLSIAAADSQDPLSAPGFFAGTVKNTLVTAKIPSQTTAYGALSILFTAVIGGAAGNSIVTTRTAGGSDWTASTLRNGAEPPAPSFSLTKPELAYVDEDQIVEFDALVTTIAPFGQSVSPAEVMYFAMEQNYILATQIYIPDDQAGTLDAAANVSVIYDIPFVISTSDAYARVSQTAIKQADNVIVQTFRLPQAYLTIEPSDIIAIEIAPFAYMLRIDEATMNGDFSVSFSAINYSFRTDIAVADSDATGTLPQTVATGSDAMPLVIDTPTLTAEQGTIAGTFNVLDGVRAYRSPFSLASVSLAEVVAGVAGPSASLFSTSSDCPWATLSGTMPAAVEPLYRTVEDSIVLALKTAQASQFGTADYYDFVAGNNCLAIGQGDSFELVYFRDVEVINDKAVRLTGLIRAQRGTDYALGHSNGDVVVLVSSVVDGFSAPLRSQAVQAAKAGSTFRYTVIGQPATRAPVSADVAIVGRQITPFSPCQLKAALVGGNDLDLSWVRRDRRNAEYVTNPAPMSETAELYDLEIMSGDTVVRTVAGLTTPAYVYTSANQTADGFAPPLATLKFRVFQIGELGRGFPRVEVVNVS